MFTKKTNRKVLTMDSRRKLVMFGGNTMKGRRFCKVFVGLAPLIALALAPGRVHAACVDGSTVAYWRFDGDYTDSCGSLDGTPVGAASIVSSNCSPLPGSSGCLALGGAPDRVDLPAPFSPVTGTLSEGTAEAWVYLESEGGGCIFNHGIAALFTDVQLSVFHASLTPAVPETEGYVARLHTSALTDTQRVPPASTVAPWHLADGVSPTVPGRDSHRIPARSLP